MTNLNYDSGESISIFDDNAAFVEKLIELLYWNFVIQVPLVIGCFLAAIEQTDHPNGISDKSDCNDQYKTFLFIYAILLLPITIFKGYIVC